MQIGLRFDIDSVIDATIGLENLLKILEEYSAKATIFVNMGKSISRKILIKRIGRKKNNVGGGEQIFKIGVTKKLGPKGVLKTIIFNPVIGKMVKKYTNRFNELNIELGVHGGRNHAEWQHFGKNFTLEKTEGEIEWSTNNFRKIFGFSPQGFSAPRFVVPNGLESILKKFGYKYHSDICEVNNIIKNELPNIPVNVVGKHTVPILEWYAAQGIDCKDASRRAVGKAEEIAKNGGVPVFYGHPSVEGKLISDYFIQFLKDSANKGFKFVSLGELI